MPVVIENLESLDAHRWEMALRGIILQVHMTVEKTAEKAQKEAAPTLTGELRKSIETHAVLRPGRSEMMSEIITTKPDAHLSWVKTVSPITPTRSSVLVFPILPGWRPKRTKTLSEKEQREQKIIVARVRGRRYNRWREKGVIEAAKRLRAAIGRLKLRIVLEV